MSLFGSSSKQNSDRGGSQPDVSKIREFEDAKMALRSKRKEPEQDNVLKDQISDLRKELMDFLTTFDKKYDHKMNVLHTDVTKTIREEVSSIKSSIVELSEKQKKINADILSIIEVQGAHGDKIKSLESGLKELKEEVISPLIQTSAPYKACEDIASELQDRMHREKNIILVGLKEPVCPLSSDRISMEKSAILQILTKMMPDCPEPVKVMRLGKYSPDKHRPIKISFENAVTRRHILRNRDKLQKDIKIYADQTPHQQKYLKDLKDVLQKRQLAGEVNIGIRYIDGVPKILKLFSKNAKTQNTIRTV